MIQNQICEVLQNTQFSGNADDNKTDTANKLRGSSSIKESSSMKQYIRPSQVNVSSSFGLCDLVILDGCTICKHLLRQVADHRI